MAAILADTHAAVWHLRESERLSEDARAALDAASRAGEPIYVASISLIEVAYLVEKGRLPEVALDRLIEALSRPLAGFVLAPLDLAVAQAIRQVPRSVVPEMPDRIIAATAIYLAVPLVTRDLRISSSHIATIW